MNLTRILAENMVNTKYEALPMEVIEKTKRQILDILGVMIPPSALDKGCIALEEIAREGGGTPESTYIGFGGKGPCWMAAFINGALCHPLDFDETIDGSPNHPMSHVFPAALAIAEKVGNVSGREFITAAALGIDFNVRLSAAPKGSLLEDYPWLSMTVFGVFSATAVAGRILGLTAEEMVNALGIALDRASGMLESITAPESEIRALRDGFGNREGVFAALMAKKGISACIDGIERLYKVFYRNNHDPSSLTSNLGREFMGLKVSFKGWPSARPTHTYIRAALNILKEYDLDPDKIEEILLTVGKYGRDMFFTPLEEKQRPRFGTNAKFSLPFVMGVVFAKKRVTIEHFFPENLGDPKVLEVAEKVKYKFDPQFPKGLYGPSVVEVRMKGGESFSKKEDIPYGHPENPMSNAELIAKFRDLARYGKKPLSDEKISHLMKRILELETVNNIKEIVQMFE